MKKLLIILLLLFTVPAQSQIVFFGQADATGKLVDTSGNANDFDENGTVPLQTSSPAACDGSAGMRGPYSGLNFFSSDPATDFDTTMSGVTTWAIELDFYANSLTGIPGGFPTLYDIDAVGDCILQQINTGTGQIRISGCIAGVAGGGDVIPINTCMFLFATFDGTKMDVGVSPSASKDSVIDTTVTYDKRWISGATLYIGKSHDFGNAFDGFTDNVKVRDTHETVFPTADPPPASDLIKVTTFKKVDNVLKVTTFKQVD